MTDSRLTESVCEIVDNVDNGRKTLDAIYWRSSRYEKIGEPLISFLKELAIRGCISQLDNILKSCYDGPNIALAVQV